MTKQTIGVLVMSYGTPESLEQVKDYYTHIRRGRPPEPAQLEDLLARYEAIGGVFPLRKNTNAQVAYLETKLNEYVQASELEAENIHFKCYQGLKHASPFIEDGLKQMKDDGIKEAVSIVLAPHYSSMSVGSYNKRAQETAQEIGMSISSINDYHLHPPFIQALAERAVETVHQFDKTEQKNVRFIFTAHSLPEKILESNDPYPEQLLESSRAIMHKAKLNNEWQFAWQSAGRTAMPWLGPDILDVLQTIRDEEQDVQNIIISPIGFVSDHLEVLYDIDIECQNKATQLGLNLKRTRSLNTDPLYIETLADMVWGKWKERNHS